MTEALERRNSVKETSKPISTIAYNTEEFLRTTLDRLVKNEVLEFYVYIKHKGEGLNEEGQPKKDHWHIYAEPSKMINIKNFMKEFTEEDPNNDEPIKLNEIRKSKFSDWYLYCLHDEKYLYKKNLKRVYYNYNPKEMQTNDVNMLNDKVEEIPTTDIFEQMEEFQAQKRSFREFVRVKGVHPMQVRGYKEMWYLVKDLALEEEKEKRELTEELEEKDRTIEELKERIKELENLSNDNKKIHLP